MHHKLVKAIVVRNAQLIRIATAVSLHDIRNTGTERTFDASQALKNHVTDGMRGITDPLLGHAILVTFQHGTR